MTQPWPTGTHALPLLSPWLQPAPLKAPPPEKTLAGTNDAEALSPPVSPEAQPVDDCRIDARSHGFEPGQLAFPPQAGKCRQLDPVDDLIQRLQSGDFEAADALFEMDPGDFSPRQILAITALAQGRDAKAGEAFDLLCTIAAGDAKARAKLISAASQTDSEQVLGRICAAAGHQPGMLKQLYAQLPPSEALVKVAGQQLENQPQEVRDIAAAYLKRRIESDADPALAQRAAQVALMQIRPQNPDTANTTEQVLSPAEKALAETALDQLEYSLEGSGKLTAADLLALKTHTGKLTAEGYNDQRAMALIARAVQKGSPGADKAFLEAMQNPASSGPAFAAFRSADSSLALALAPLVKKLPPDENNPFAARTAVMRKLQPGVTQGQLSECGHLYQAKFNQRLAGAFERAMKKDPEKRSDFEKLSTLIYAQGLLKDPESDLDDPSDFDADRLQQDIETLMQSSAVRFEMGRIRTDVLQEVFQRREHPLGVIADQEAYIYSEEFKTYLDLMPPERRGAAISLEIQKLAAMSPERAVRVAQDLAVEELSGRSVEVLGQLDESVLDAQLDLAQRTTARNVKDTLSGGKKAIDAAVWAEAKDDIKLMFKAARAFDAEIDQKKVMEKHIKQIESKYPGVKPLKALLALATGITVAQKLPDFNLAIASDLAKTLYYSKDSIDELMKLVSRGEIDETSGELVKKGLSAKASKAFKILGVAGDALATLAYTQKLIKAINAGDETSALIAGVNTAGSGLSAVGGAMILAGSEGAFPIAIAGAVLSLGGLILDAVIGNTPAEQFLIDLGYEK